MGYLSGKEGSVTQNGTSYPFRKWKVAQNINLPKVTNFTSPDGCQEIVPAIQMATITIEAPFDGEMQWTLGQELVWELHYTNAQFITINGIIKEVTPDNDVEGNPIVNMVIESNGSFDGSIYDS